MALFEVPQEAFLNRRLITVSAMQRRYSVEEEVALKSASDLKVQVIRDRLFNARYIDLDTEEVEQGVQATVAYLATVDDPDNAGQKLVADTDARIQTLLADGTDIELYDSPVNA